MGVLVSSLTGLGDATCKDEGKTSSSSASGVSIGVNLGRRITAIFAPHSLSVFTAIMWSSD